MLLLSIVSTGERPSELALTKEGMTVLCVVYVNGSSFFGAVEAVVEIPQGPINPLVSRVNLVVDWLWTGLRGDAMFDRDEGFNGFERGVDAQADGSDQRSPKGSRLLGVRDTLQNAAGH